MKVEEKLLHIQQKLKAPKNQHNKFGNYNYRSCEDILEAVKPILAEAKCILTISDQIMNIGERFYVCAMAKLTDIESGEAISNTAYAREETERKGSDGSQITGAASSYARKYCLNGLFLIDDTKDADTNESKEMEQKAEEKEQAKKPKKGKLPTEKITALINKCEHEAVPVEFICEQYKVKTLYQMNEAQWMNCIENWDQVLKRAEIWKEKRTS